MAKSQEKLATATARADTLIPNKLEENSLHNATKDRSALRGINRYWYSEAMEQEHRTAKYPSNMSSMPTKIRMTCPVQARNIHAGV